MYVNIDLQYYDASSSRYVWYEGIGRDITECQVSSTGSLVVVEEGLGCMWE
jgi:hypothetical protein